MAAGTIPAGASHENTTIAAPLIAKGVPQPRFGQPARPVAIADPAAACHYITKKGGRTLHRLYLLPLSHQKECSCYSSKDGAKDSDYGNHLSCLLCDKSCPRATAEQISALFEKNI